MIRLRSGLRVSVATLATLGLGAAVAHADPTASTPPTITGTATYGSTLTCNNGIWSAGAGSFTYAWELADSTLPVASGPTLKLKAAWVSEGLACVVSAKDATGSGTSTSAPVAVKPAAATVTISAARQVAAHKIVIRGQIAPTASLAGGNASLILYRETKTGLTQLSFNGPQTRPAKNGSFTLTSATEPVGANTYVIQYVPSALGYAPQTLLTRKITVKAG